MVLLAEIVAGREPNHRESLRADSLVFDRIRCFPTLARTICAKIFIASTCVLRAPSTKNVTINTRKFFFKIERRTDYRRYKNPYFIVFFTAVTMCAQIWSHVVCTHE
jgi:hypothetical protein